MPTLGHASGGQGTTGVPPPDMLHEAGSLWLLRLLQDIQLAQFYRPILEELNVTRPEHFDFVRPEDLDGVGMGRPGEGPLPQGPAVSFRSLLVATLSTTTTPTSPLLACKSLASCSPPPPLPHPFDSGLPQPSVDWLKL